MWTVLLGWWQNLEYDLPAIPVKTTKCATYIKAFSPGCHTRVLMQGESSVVRDLMT